MVGVLFGRRIQSAAAAVYAGYHLIREVRSRGGMMGVKVKEKEVLLLPWSWWSLMYVYSFVSVT